MLLPTAILLAETQFLFSVCPRETKSKKQGSAEGIVFASKYP